MGRKKKLNIHPTSKKKKELSSNNLTNLKMLLVKLNLVSFSLADFKVNSFWVSNVSCRIYD